MAKSEQITYHVTMSKTEFQNRSQSFVSKVTFGCHLQFIFNMPLHELAPIPFGFCTLVPAVVFCCHLWEKLTLSFWVKARWRTYIFSIFAEQRGNVLSNERLSIRCVDYKTGDASNEQRRTGGFSIKVSDSSVAKPQNQKNLNIYPTGRNGDKTCHKGCG